MSERSRGARAARAAWLTYWGAMRRWHRYEVVGSHWLDAPRPALIVGYHGRPVAHDLCMLQSYLHERTGRFPRAFIHEGFKHNAVLRAFVEGVDFLTGDDDTVRDALARGDHLVVTPGGTREGCRSSRTRYQVDWGRRRGYLELAMRHGLPIVPAASSGVDDTYLGLNNGDATGRRLGAPHGIPVWLGVGPLGLWPLSPPFPVKVVQHLGAPFTAHLAPGVGRDRETIDALHAEVVASVQRLLDTATRSRHDTARTR